ncbi:hypothetical protein HGRIS_007238 [Hohenbuehelia grisea]|uniref:NADH:flavin oxidoreductase/NADH oxidase N-terminal domain-containing protein n=1 Tax=Hohenbuehelia grisea TaxID=104357 RepID=A0ABR3JCN4_9AGAR
MKSNNATLFQPIKLGSLQLSHRIVLAPLTRIRATATTHVPLLPVKEYYAQRSFTPGTLLITEATTIAQEASGIDHVPGIESDAQIEAWKEIASAIHAKRSFVFMQLRAYGRAANPNFLSSMSPPVPYTAASGIPLLSRPHEDPTPRPLSIADIQRYITLFAEAARRAVHDAGLDGVELHGANGYLIDQFLQDVTNDREDAYGQTIENRARFALEVLEKVVEAVGAERVGIRLSPWSMFQEMGMRDPRPTFSYLVDTIKARFPSLAYIHVVEPRVHGNEVVESDGADESNDFIRDIWAGRPLISAGGYTRSSALKRSAENDNELIAFGRWFIANPDLPHRLARDLPLTQYDRSSFYLAGDATGKGYTDYPFASNCP